MDFFEWFSIQSKIDKIIWLFIFSSIIYFAFGVISAFI